jgi:hypothetical protein
MSNQETEKKSGCLYPSLLGITTILILGGLAEYSHPLMTVIILFTILFGIAFIFTGIAFLSIPYFIIKNIITGKRPYLDLHIENENEFDRKNAWLIFPISLLAFFLGYLIISRDSGDLYTYLGVGIFYGGIQYWMLKKGYFDPSDYDFNWLNI